MRYRNTVPDAKTNAVVMEVVYKIAETKTGRNACKNAKLTTVICCVCATSVVFATLIGPVKIAVNH